MKTPIEIIYQIQGTGTGLGGFVTADPNEWRDLRAAIEAQAEKLAQYEQWVNDLHSGMYLNCVYCGHRYGPDSDVPVSMADALKEHIEECPKHPMSALKEELAQLRAALNEIHNRRGKSRVSQIMLQATEDSE